MEDMGVLRWLADNWDKLLNSVGVIGALFVAAGALWSGVKTQRIANLITITTNHREIWMYFSSHPKLARVLDSSADVTREPITAAEAEFVNFVILHLSSAYYAMKDGTFIKLEGLRSDVCMFFSLPLTRAVWEKSKILQNDDFVKFVESCQIQK
jgi:hypothetical protein